jgi:hypothetical protein
VQYEYAICRRSGENDGKISIAPGVFVSRRSSLPSACTIQRSVPPDGSSRLNTIWFPRGDQSAK